MWFLAIKLAGWVGGGVGWWVGVYPPRLVSSAPSPHIVSAAAQNGRCGIVNAARRFLYNNWALKHSKSDGPISLKMIEG